MLDIVAKIRAVRGALGVPERELANRLGVSPQALNSRMKTGKFTTEELERMAEALGVKYVCYFELPDGTRF